MSSLTCSLMPSDTLRLEEKLPCWPEQTKNGSISRFRIRGKAFQVSISQGFLSSSSRSPVREHRPAQALDSPSSRRLWKPMAGQSKLKAVWEKEAPSHSR